MAQCRECKLKNAKSPSVKLEPLARLHVRTLARWNWELGTGNWEFLFSVSRFPFLLYARLQSCKLENLQVNTLTRWNWEMGIGNFYFLFSVFYFLNCIL